jgi:dihydrofolate synthase / folylpolyglutamate synthase
MLPPAAPLSDWLTWLESLSPTEINLGLERVQLILGRLDLPRPAHVLLIAGTNGKGSSVAMADALLRASGLRVGAYTSPHISRYNERIVVNGIAASDAEIITAFERIEAVRGDTELTYFEFATLAAAVVFAAAGLDVWVLEVGLGGRLDATNAIEPTASLITNISLDHCDWLGDDVETIAAEKAGIMRRGIPTVFGDTDVPEAIRCQADASGVTLLLPGRDFDLQLCENHEWSWRGPSGGRQGLQPPGLAGEVQLRNAAAVLALLDVAGLVDAVDAELINRVLPALTLAGRTQHLLIAGLGCDNNEWLIDVAHNPAAAEVLATTLGSRESTGATFAIVGLLNDKDVAGIIEPLAEHVDTWVAMTAASHRAVAAKELARQISNITGKACLVAGSPREAIEFARRSASENDRILATGSFFTVGPILEQLTAESQPKT